MRHLRPWDVVEMRPGFEFEGRSLAFAHCEVVSVIHWKNSDDLLLRDPYGFPVLAVFPTDCCYIEHVEVFE